MILVAALAVGGVRGTAWVYVLIGLACPLMMVLMMGGMHGSGSRGTSGNSSDADESGRTRPGNN